MFNRKKKETEQVKDIEDPREAITLYPTEQAISQDDLNPQIEIVQDEVVPEVQPVPEPVPEPILEPTLEPKIDNEILKEEGGEGRGEPGEEAEKEVEEKEMEPAGDPEPIPPLEQGSVQEPDLQQLTMAYVSLDQRVQQLEAVLFRIKGSI